MKDKVAAPAAVIFDFDGVIVDSEPLHWRAFHDLLAPLGIRLEWEPYVAKYLGFDDRDVFREAFKDAGRALAEAELPGLIERKAQAFEALVHGGNPKPYPGVVHLIASLSSRIPVALCSGALKRDVMPILRTLRIDRAFHAMVTAEDVKQSKPDPASYRLALERLRAVFPGRGIEASRSVAVEDTPAGIAAARGAGMKVLALANTYPHAELERATVVVDTLEGLGIDDLGRVAAG